VSRQLGADLVHRPGEVDLDDVVGGVRLEVLVRGLGQEARRVGLERLDEDSLRRDLAEGLAVGRAGDGDRDRQRGAVAGEPDHPDVVAEVLAAELRSDAEAAGQLEHLRLELHVPEAVRRGRAFARQLVEILCAGVLRCLQGELGAGATDDDGQVVGRAGRRAERAQLLVEEAHHGSRVQDALVSW
jgi:hypothetical protein